MAVGTPLKNKRNTRSHSMTKVDNFWQPKVDSLQVRIPLSDVEIIDTTLIDRLITIHEKTGEIIKEEKGKTHTIQTEDGLSFSFWVRKRKPIHQEEVLTEITFLLNSKHLKEKYFEGITTSNVVRVVNEINMLGVIKVSKEVLLKADVLDIDVCIDFPATKEEFKEVAVDRHSALAQIRVMDVKKVHNRKDNLGLELNKRDHCYESRPHTKFYHKSVELDKNSEAFAKAHLQGIDFSDIGRFEFNLKNRDYLRHYSLDRRIKSLRDLLTCSTLDMTARQIYKNWFVKKEYRPPSGDRWYLQQIKIAWSRLPIEEVEWCVEFQCDGTSNRNSRKKIRTLYHQFMNKNQKEFHEANRILLWDKLQDYFTMKNRTYDVRKNVIDSSTVTNPKNLKK